MGKDLVFVVCRISPCTSCPTLPASLSSRLGQAALAKTAPVPYALLSGDLAALLIRKWSPLLYLPNLAWPHDCFDQCNSVAPLIGTSHSLPLRSQLSQKDTVALRPPCSEKPQPRGETWKMKCHVGRERDQSAPDVQGRMPLWEWSLQP